MGRAVYPVSLLPSPPITTFTWDHVLFPYMVICVTFLIFGDRDSLLGAAVLRCIVLYEAE